MRNVILIDYCPPREWIFRDVLEKCTGRKWEILSLQSNRNHGGVIQNVVRYLKYGVAAMRAFFRRKEFANVIAWQQFHGIILAFFLRLFGAKKTFRLTVMTFIYNQKKSIIGRLYFLFVKYAVTSGYIDKIIVFAESEKVHYTKLFNTKKELFESMFLGVEDQYHQYEKYILDGSYYFSAGRSNRDYKFLIDSWDELDRNLLIVCDSLRREDTEEIKIKTNCYGKEYLRLLAGSHAVIISLKNDGVSSGQLVLLHAMMLGKPVIMTRNSAMREYLEDGATGVLIDKNKEQLKEALLKLENKGTYVEMSQNARAFFLKNFTLEAEAKHLAALINQSA